MTRALLASAAKKAHFAMYLTPREYCASWGIGVLLMRQGKISEEDMPRTHLEETLYGCRWLWERGVPFQAIDFDEEGNIEILQTRPVQGSFPVMTYIGHGPEWMLQQATKETRRYSFLKAESRQLHELAKESRSW